MVNYCSRCIMPDSRPGVRLDERGLCNACRWYETKRSIDWNARRDELRRVADWARKNSHGAWDCVLGVSGGKDSTWQAFYLRDELGLNPLLVQFSSSEGTELGRRNLENLVQHDFSLLSVHPKPLTAKKLAKKSFLQYGNLAKYSETALFPAPFRMAMMYEIPLVFFGENPGMEAGDSNVGGEGWDASTIRYNNTLGGADIEIWKSDDVSINDLLPYVFPSADDLKRWGGRALFMGYYLDWSAYRNGVFAIQKGLETQTFRHEAIGCHMRHNTLDWDAYPLHSFLKFIKLGFGSTTEFVCYDVRAGRVSREEAIALVKALDGKCDPSFAVDYCSWIDLPVEEFWRETERFYGKMWERTSDGWALKDPIWLREPPRPDLNIASVIDRVDTDIVAAKCPTLPLHPEPWEDEWNLR